jgi:hypothetical protein
MLEQAFGYCTQWYSPELEQGFATGPPPKIVSPKPQFFGPKKACCLCLRGGGRWPTALTKKPPLFYWCARGLKRKAIAAGTKHNRTIRAYEASMNMLPVDRALAIYDTIANRSEPKGTRERLSQHLWKVFIEGEHDPHRLTVHGLAYLQSPDRERDS